ncbi:Ceramide kinase [Plecturocebus cupreus]
MTIPGYSDDVQDLPSPFTGSTDCVCYSTVGTSDAETSALHIVVGEPPPPVRGSAPPQRRQGSRGSCAPGLSCSGPRRGFWLLLPCPGAWVTLCPLLCSLHCDPTQHPAPRPPCQNSLSGGTPSVARALSHRIHHICDAHPQPT